MVPSSPAIPPSLRALSLVFFSLVITSSPCSRAFRVPSPSAGINNRVVSSARPPPLPPTTTTSMMMSRRGNDESDNKNINMPSEEEMAQQKKEAYDALSSYHETSRSFATTSPQIASLLEGLDEEIAAMSEGETVRAEYWRCEEGAVGYGVPMDPAAGLKRGSASKPYECSVRVDVDLDNGGGGLRLVESIRFGVDGDGGGDVGSASSSDKNDGEGDAQAARAVPMPMPFVRSVPLGANVDVDAVDGSYSLDAVIRSDDDDDDDPSGAAALPLLPPSLLVGAMDPTAIRFLVEHTLAVSETERCRCFLLYGDAGVGIDDGDDEFSGSDEEEEGDDAVGDEDFAIVAARKAKEGSSKRKERDDSISDEREKNYRLLGVVLAEETKVMPERIPAKEEEGTDEYDYAEEFISQMIESPSPTPPSSSPLDVLETKQSDSENDQRERLMRSLDKHNQRVVESAIDSATGDANGKMERHPLGMFGLTSGVWLGDTFVRESLPSPAASFPARRSRQPKGFGKKSRTATDGDGEGGGDRFATWNVGVQKVALRFEWDYRESVSQSYTYGKFMGAATFPSDANTASDGTVVVNEARRAKRRGERRVVWDMDGGAYVAGLIGSGYFRAPRYLSFGRGRGSGADSYLTEFMVFYRGAAKDVASPSTSGGGGEKSGIIDAEIIEGGAAIEDNAVPVYYCSRTSRLYDASNGSLMQGSTAFFSMKQPLLDSM